MITKGQVLPYYFAKFFQKAMFKFLRSFPQFALIGEPVSMTHLKQILDQEEWINENYFINFEFDKWVSGDYSAATDSIKSIYTMVAFESFLVRSGLDEIDCNILRSVLYSSIVEYPPGSSPDGSALKSVVQKSGQLMGSPLSFPILCMINLIAYAIAMKRYLKSLGCNVSIPLDRLPVKVNGDDILFRTNAKFYKFWLESISEVGFSLSIGKNYVHPNVMTINSVCYHFSESKDSYKFEQIGYLNIGLLTGQSKLRVRGSKELLPVDHWYNTVMDGALNKLKTHKFFMFYHSDRIRRLTDNRKYNLFISKYLGGLGFILHPEVYDDVIFDHTLSKLIHKNSHVNEFQSKLATFLYERYVTFKGTLGDSKKLFFRPLVGQSFLKTKCLEDESPYHALLLPKGFSNAVYEKNLNKKNVVSSLFLWSRDALFSRTDINPIDIASEDNVLSLKAVKGSLWKTFNRKYASIELFEPSLIQAEFVLKYVPLSEIFVKEPDVSSLIHVDESDIIMRDYWDSFITPIGYRDNH
jgi:hypothetical protein